MTRPDPIHIPKPQVAYLVNTKKLDAVRTTIAGRQCWRIDVSSTTYGSQKKLFDQMITRNHKEA